MGGANGERVDRNVVGFNESQSECVVMPSFKRNYAETLTSAVAAFRADFRSWHSYNGGCRMHCLSDFGSYV